MKKPMKVNDVDTCTIASWSVLHKTYGETWYLLILRRRTTLGTRMIFQLFCQTM